MDTLTFQRTVPITGQYDFIVCGGGMTGVAAAVSAARAGLRTALIEQGGCLGGTATACGVTHLLGGRKNLPVGQAKNVGGLFEELTKRMAANGWAIEPTAIDRDRNPHGWYPNLAEGVPFDLEHMKVTLEALCMEAGVTLCYFTSVVDVAREAERITHLILHNKSGLFALSAPLFADCTGDGDVAALAGCAMSVGREEDGLMAAASLEMQVEHVDGAALADYIWGQDERRFRRLIASLREEGIWTFPYDIFISVLLTQPDVFMINTIRQVGVNGVDGDSMTRGMVDGRKECLQLFDILKEYFPGFGNSRIRRIAERIGIRETRRLVGMHTLTAAELVAGTRFPDSIACSSYGWDLPDPKRPSHQPLEHAAKPTYTHIPYRCLLPREVTNLIVAGRCISVERDVLGPVRVMGPCMGMGSAAGLAASLALAQDGGFADVSIQALHAALAAAGCVYDEMQLSEQGGARK